MRLTRRGVLHTTELSASSRIFQRSSTSAVSVVQSTQNLEGEYLACIMIRRKRLTILFWDLLFNALMGSGLIEVLNIVMAGHVAAASPGRWSRLSRRTNTRGQAKSIPHLGTNEETDKAWSHMKWGFRLFKLTVFFLLRAIFQHSRLYPTYSL